MICKYIPLSADIAEAKTSSQRSLQGSPSVPVPGVGTSPVLGTPSNYSVVKFKEQYYRVRRVQITDQFPKKMVKLKINGLLSIGSIKQELPNSFTVPLEETSQRAPGIYISVEIYALL